MKRIARSIVRLGAIVVGAVTTVSWAQAPLTGRVEIAFNRYYTSEELLGHVRAVAAAYPELVELRTIGRSLQGRELVVAVVTARAAGSADAKPAMWIDGNVHGNEIQASEVVLYTLWYLTRAYGQQAPITELLDRSTFYLLVSVNPDARQHFFDVAGTPNWPRGNLRPVDDDQDGQADEDGPDDLDGDGEITQMWRPDPHGRWVRSQTDPRRFLRVKPDEDGAWTWAGEEGLDNDGDGRVNEDSLGGDDMNRNWPSDWQPRHVQWGAGPYPLSAPETRAVAQFILDHRNIAGVQSYHNAGGMILRGPGVAWRESEYGAADRAVYDAIGRVGEQLLPYYRLLVIHKDLYPVHGGFVTWTSEGLGIVSFTNELWTAAKYFQGSTTDPSDDQDWLFRDRLQFGTVFKDYTEYRHPTYGPVLVGGLNRWSARSTPTFMLEEECHRNFAFTAFHAQQMPRVRFDRVEAAQVPGAPDLWMVTAEVRNEGLIPTRTAQAQTRGIGAPDLLTVSGPGVEVLAAGRLADWFDRHMDPVAHEPARVRVPEGLGGRAGQMFRFVVRAAGSAQVTLRYESARARPVERVVDLVPVAP